MPPTSRLETELYRKGFKLIAGVDEAGRGPLAGPVVAAAVVLPEKIKLHGIRDSKKLSPSKRERFYDIIRGSAICWGVGIVSEKVIDEINILRASLLAMQIAVSKLSVKPGHILVDGKFKVPNIKMPQRILVGGDDRSISIAAASIVAKVERDRIMVAMDKLYPGWQFGKHKGYGTALHLKLLCDLGPSPIHRMSFHPTNP